MIEQTLVMIKPDGVQHKMIDPILDRLAKANMRIAGIQSKMLSEAEAADLYREHKGKWYFDRNIKHVTSGPVLVLSVEGENAVHICREVVENFRKEHEDMIELPRNLVHATAEPEKVDDELEAVGLTRYII